MFRKTFLVLTLFLVFACNEDSKQREEIDKINIEFKVERFDQKFANAEPEDLPQIKRDYPFLFPAQYPDSVWVNKMQDSIQLELNTEVTAAFKDFSKEEDELKTLFQHIKYYFPSFKAPTVITVTSDVDYRNKVLLTPDFLFIALDTYLGKDHQFYMGIQEYLKKNFERAQILPDVASQYAERYVPQPQKKNFLATMLYYGKLLYLKDRWLPDTPDFEKIGYTEEELKWADANEEQIWRYFVDKELIFDSDTKLYSRFLYPAPFSKFYLELDNESPAMLGQYIGWHIIRDYMDKNDVSLLDMLDTDAETIFNKAKYKPKK